MEKQVEKRTVDMQVIGEWVEPQSRVLDLGCGRGELMAYLVQAKQIAATGVDLDFARISACVARGLSAYQGDMTDFMRAFPDRHFDRIICSRTVHDLDAHNHSSSCQNSKSRLAASPCTPVTFFPIN